ncbi:MAG: O-antigen ligase family protein [Eubacteriales bacterium]|nr:O-antigen ligase family protein [Eubacteriales bacterium]
MAQRFFQSSETGFLSASRFSSNPPGPSGRPVPLRDSISRSPAVRLLDFVIIIYLYLCILWHTGIILQPVNTLITKPPVYNLQTHLLTAGIVLVLADWILARSLRRGPGLLLLYGICASAAVSSFLLRSYGVQKNRTSILWMVVAVTLFYSSVFRMKKKLLSRSLKVLFGTLLTVWFIACCLSLYQFVMRIGVYGPNYASSPWLGGNGFTGRRLIGVFAFPEYGAIPGVMLLVGSVYYILTLRSRLLKVLLVLMSLPLFWYIVLSGSRNAAAAIYETVFVGFFLYILKRFRRFSPVSLLASLCAALAVLLLFHGLFTGTMEAAKKVPRMDTKNTFSGSVLKSGAVSLADAGQVLKSGSASLADAGRFPLRKPTAGVPDGAMASSSEETGTNPEKKSDGKTKEKKNQLLERKYSDGDLSTGRLTIWKDYLSLSGEIGLFGLSPENASKYIQEHNPDLRIATYIKENYPESYAAGYVFHTHSGYFRVFVSAGFLGFGLLTLFYILCAVSAARCAARPGKISFAFLFPLLIALAGASSALFDNEIYFNQNPTSFLFWICLSIMLRSAVRTHTSAAHNS